MEKVISPAVDTNVLGHVKVAVKYHGQFQEEEVEILKMSGEKEAIFHGDFWESEAMWQFLRVLHEDMDRPLPDLIELLDHMKGELKRESMITVADSIS